MSKAISAVTQDAVDVVLDLTIEEARTFDGHGRAKVHAKAAKTVPGVQPGQGELALERPGGAPRHEPGNRPSLLDWLGRIDRLHRASAAYYLLPDTAA